MLLSIIVPCYNEEEALPIFYETLIRTLHTISDVEYEILFIDDGSTDGTLKILRQLSENNNVYYLSFSRNFGKESAMYAGFCNAKGDYVTIMDADLQDPPELLPQMLEIVQSGEYDSVATRRVDRKGEPPIRSWFARQFYKFLNRFSEADVVDGARDYRLMKREMVEAIVSMGEYNRFSKGIFGWIGFRTYWLPYENKDRIAGETKWSFWKLFRYAINGIINFSNMPLVISSVLGIVITLIAFAFIIFIVIRRLVFGDPVAGWASTVCIVMFLGGIQLLCLGIMGQYMAKTYMETKRRPIYIVWESHMSNTGPSQEDEARESKNKSSSM